MERAGLGKATHAVLGHGNIVGPGHFSSPLAGRHGPQKQVDVEQVSVKDVHRMLNNAAAANTHRQQPGAAVKDREPPAPSSYLTSPTAASKEHQNARPNRRSPKPTNGAAVRAERRQQFNTFGGNLPRFPKTTNQKQQAAASRAAVQTPLPETRRSPTGTNQRAVVHARKSSPGTVLRRGSQVSTAPKRVRQYRHPRDMEVALMDSDDKIVELEDKLSATTAVLTRTQQELAARNADLEAASVKIQTLMQMVQNLLRHVADKNGTKPLTGEEEKTIHNAVGEPLESFRDHESVDTYIHAKIDKIRDLLPRALPGNADEDLFSELDSNASSGQFVPPPLPASAKVSRR